MLSADRSCDGSVVYRSVDHKTLKGLCGQLSQTNPQNVAIVPSNDFGRIADLLGLRSACKGNGTWLRTGPAENGSHVSLEGGPEFIPSPIVLGGGPVGSEGPFRKCRGHAGTVVMVMVMVAAMIAVASLHRPG